MFLILRLDKNFFIWRDLFIFIQWNRSCSIV